MLPTKGYFRKTVCPYNGICSRPYCHYRHTKEEYKCLNEDSFALYIKRLVKETVTKVLSTNQIQQNPAYQGIDKDAIIANVLQEIENPKHTDEIGPIYNPTPKAQLKKRHIPIAAPPIKPSYSRDTRPKTINIKSNVNPVTSAIFEQYDTSEQTIHHDPNQARKEGMIQCNEFRPNISDTYTSKRNVIPEVIDGLIKSVDVRPHDYMKVNADIDINKTSKKEKSTEQVAKYEVPTFVQNYPEGNIKSSNVCKAQIESTRERSGEVVTLLDDLKGELSMKELVHKPFIEASTTILDILEPSDSCEKRKLYTDYDSNKKMKLDNVPTDDMGQTEMDASVSQSSVWKPPKNAAQVSYENTFNNDFPPLKKINTNEVIMSGIRPKTTNSMTERWRRATEIISSKGQTNGVLKINPVPNVQLYMAGKNALNQNNYLVRNHTLSTQMNEQTTLQLTTQKVESYGGKNVVKTIVRRAHTAPKYGLPCPTVLFEESSRIPLSVRKTSLKKLHEEFCKFVEEVSAGKKAQQMELDISTRLASIKPYKNAIALALLRIRKTNGATDECREKKLILTSDSIPNFTNGWTLYKCFAEYLISDQEYKCNGFPLKHLSKEGCAYIEVSARRKRLPRPEDSCQRTCDHCSAVYFVDDLGFPQKEYDCSYHWGKLRLVRECGNLTERYTCCDGDIEAEPCTTGRYHVCNTFNEDHLEGFVSTAPQNPQDDVDKAGVLGIDCEMCYTTNGIELARCTLVDLNGRTVYDKIVVPEAPIIDYCTRFSGITEDIIRGSSFRLSDIQKDLCELLNHRTILVGHSLENDLKVLKLFHKALVDTSIVFPHKRGLPYKNSLKRIAKDIINLTIQESENGHDSYEDANACVKIMLWKIREDAKRRKPRLIIRLEQKDKIRGN